METPIKLKKKRYIKKRKKYSSDSDYEHKDKKLRDWMFTINNPNHPEDKIVFNEETMHFLVFQLEKGEEGTPHYQGYIEFKSQMRFLAVKKLLIRANISPRMARGTKGKLLCRHYCTKPHDGCECKHCVKCKPGDRIDGPWEFGILERQGKRNDVDDAKKLIDDGADYDAVNEENPSVCAKYGNWVNKSVERRSFNNIPVKRKVKVIVYYGEAGTAKTGRIFEKYDYNDVYLLENPGKKNLWFDRYYGQFVLLIDDFSGWIQYSVLLHILDIYRRSYQIKNAFTSGAWGKVYITSNKTPYYWYENLFKNDNTAYIALMRRIHIVEEILEGNPLQLELLKRPLKYYNKPKKYKKEENKHKCADLPVEQEMFDSPPDSPLPEDLLVLYTTKPISGEDLFIISDESGENTKTHTRSPMK